MVLARVVEVGIQATARHIVQISIAAACSDPRRRTLRVSVSLDEQLLLPDLVDSFVWPSRFIVEIGSWVMQFGRRLAALHVLVHHRLARVDVASRTVVANGLIAVVLAAVSLRADQTLVAGASRLRRNLLFSSISVKNN